jgi:hypothetical protein
MGYLIEIISFEYNPVFKDKINHFGSEDGSIIYLQNVSNTAHIHTVQRSKIRISINSEPPWKPKIGRVK